MVLTMYSKNTFGMLLHSEYYHGYYNQGCVLPPVSAVPVCWKVKGIGESHQEQGKSYYIIDHSFSDAWLPFTLCYDLAFASTAHLLRAVSLEAARKVSNFERKLDIFCFFFKQCIRETIIYDYMQRHTGGLTCVYKMQHRGWYHHFISFLL